MSGDGRQIDSAPFLSWSIGCETPVVRFEEVREHSLQIVIIGVTVADGDG